MTAESTTAPTVYERDVFASRLAYLTVGLPTAGFVGAILYGVYDGITVCDVTLFGVMYLITTLGVEAGFHRYFSHRSFDASQPVKLFFALAGSMAAQGPVVFWVANHRLHHAFTDTDRDPHSPKPRGAGWRGRAKGLWHGHIGWLFDIKKNEWNRHTRDWLADRAVMKINVPIGNPFGNRGARWLSLFQPNLQAPFFRRDGVCDFTLTQRLPCLRCGAATGRRPGLREIYGRRLAR